MSGIVPKKSAARGRKRRTRPPSSAKRSRQRVWPWLVSLSLGSLALAVLFVLAWARQPNSGSGKWVELELPRRQAALDAAHFLRARGLVQSPWLFAAYRTLFFHARELETGSHLVRDTLSARELLSRLTRSPARPVQKLTIPEGFTIWQIAERLMALGICSKQAFLAEAQHRTLLDQLGIGAGSVEGYLFPATYELFVDSPPRAVIVRLITEMRRRLRLIPGASDKLAELQRTRGWGEHEVLTLASMVEKEAQLVEEQPLIASVFFNRLDDPDFRPPRSLQSDPTAGYGCVLLGPERVPSCRGFDGRITPALLRDLANPYNTYAHPGLPPGPIANPGVGALSAVLEPARTDYLFFVSDAGGRHHFSREYSEHTEAVEKRKNLLKGAAAR